MNRFHLSRYHKPMMAGDLFGFDGWRKTLSFTVLHMVVYSSQVKSRLHYLRRSHLTSHMPQTDRRFDKICQFWIQGVVSTFWRILGLVGFVFWAPPSFPEETHWHQTFWRKKRWRYILPSHRGSWCFCVCQSFVSCKKHLNLKHRRSSLP